MSFPAKFRGECVQCGLNIKVDDLIERTADGWAHETCPEVDSEPTCPRCWLIHPKGACDRE